ncbi:Maspardin [Echinococcus granulosus]|uniref:Maspardin n=1 Tax=Echinococcus granulosus TaxID=6210 RepID=W6U7Y4_ECHGR|nr:Maspardin [Echinococcus granulosus]EUB56441.1 Maspardin [Echinococcus granulosus]
MENSDLFGYEEFNDSSNKSSLKIDKYTIDFYDFGPKEISCPIICLPPTACDASIYYKVQLLLSREGFRIISINYPETYNANDFCEVFLKMLGELHVTGVHLIGSSLGGFLAQKFYEISEKSNAYVKSLVLCNTFTDTYSFESRFSSRLQVPVLMFWMLPVSLLRMTLEYPPVSTDADEDVRTSVELAKQQMNKMSQSELASRLTMACTTDHVTVEELQDVDVTIVEVGDLDTTYKKLYEGVHRAYPEAKVASIDSGGLFPFLSRYDEFAAYMKLDAFVKA